MLRTMTPAMTHSMGRAFASLCFAVALLTSMSAENAAAQNAPRAAYDKGATAVTFAVSPPASRAALLYAAPVRLSSGANGARSVVLHQSAPRSLARSAAPADHGVRAAARTHQSVLFSESVTETNDYMQPSLRQDRWLAFDKVQHFVVSFLWTLASQYFFVAKLGMAEGTALPLSILSSASAGAAKEIYDWRHPDEQTASMRDLVADAAGIVIAGGVILL